MAWEGEIEMLNDFYENNINNNRIKVLTEYYKFHKDVPRIFIKTYEITYAKYHNKKRKIEYENI